MNVGNYRRESSGLDRKRLNELINGWFHARRLGLSLNAFVSFRPIAGDELAPVERCKLFARVRNKLGVYARLHRFPPTFVWAREIHCDHTGEHLHVLMHVPDRLFGDFQQRLVKWFPGPGEMDVRAAHYRVTLTDSGKRKSAISYICKQMTPQAWWRRGLIRVPGGKILGKRGGVSANLTSKAITHFNQDRVHPVRNGGGVPEFGHRQQGRNDRIGSDTAPPACGRYVHTESIRPAPCCLSPKLP
jgi:hypothetical protein